MATTARKQHTENPATGRALCGRELTEDNHGYRSTLESCQACANKAEHAHQRYVNGEGR
jgi:predicted secreted protein